MGVNEVIGIQAIQGIQAEERQVDKKQKLQPNTGKHKENYYILDTQKFWQAFWCKR